LQDIELVTVSQAALQARPEYGCTNVTCLSLEHMLRANMKTRIALDHRARTQPPPVTPAPDDARRIRRLMLYFGMVCAVEGTARPDGIIAQPLTYYFKEVHS
jgi:hypothetical protein